MCPKHQALLEQVRQTRAQSQQLERCARKTRWQSKTRCRQGGHQVNVVRLYVMRQAMQAAQHD